MRLTEMLNNFINQNATSVKSTGSVEMQPLSNNIAAQIKALVPGQILQGEVLENVSDTVKLLVNINGENIALQARLEQSVSVAVGKSLLFQVKNNGATLSLSPLFENMGMEQNAAKALETASLPVDGTTMEMTKTMMQEGISIDKNTLQQVYHEMVSNQDAELMDIIDLHKLGMPVTEENLNQLHSYKTMTHQLSGGIEQMAQDVTQLLQHMVEQGQQKDIPALLRAVLQPGAENIVMQEENALQGQKTIVTEDGASGAQAKQVVITENQTANPAEGTEAVRSNALQEEGKTQAGITQSMDVKQLFQELGKAMGDKEALTRLVHSDKFRTSINELLQKELMLRPEAADKKGVQEMYRQLTKQLGVISEALTQVGQEQSSLGKTVQNMSQNVNFLNQMNSMYAYVQLPIKLSEGNAHGELYVYSNKRHLASNEGEVSALLHLDMEHLGPVDVHVKLKESKVSTQFFLQDEDMLDFLYEHMDILTERLKKRGYDMTCRMTVRGEEEQGGSGGNTTFRELINENSNIPTLVNYSFDVRA